MEFSAGEIDAFAVVRPSAIGDTIALGPQNLTNAQSEIYFQDPISIQENRVKIAFETLSENAQISVTPATFENFVSASTLIQSADLAINPLLGSNGVSFRANATLSLSGLYQGQGTDLNVLQRDGTNWVAAPQFTYNAASNTITLAGLTNNVAVAVERVGSPDARIANEAGAFGLQFAPVVGWVHTLERTTNFVDWTVVTNITVEAATLSVIKDENTLAGGGFYRLRVTRP